MGLRTADDHPLWHCLCWAIRLPRSDIGLRGDLREFHLDDDAIEVLVQESQHPNLLNNPVTITEDMLRELYMGLR